ncbi:MAG: response regulator [Blastocatellia bacterium]|nr:response regulator [Blastocatellia bacterium]
MNRGSSETAVTTSDGSETWILVTLTPVFDDAALAGVLMIGRDITGHRRAAERAAEADKLRALGQLSSGVAHNFNNALSVILGRTQLLKRRLTEPLLVRDLDIIEQVSHEAASTVRRIQNFARRRLHESFDPIDLRMLVADTLEMTSTRWRSDSNAHGVRYHVRFDAHDGDYSVRGNDSELREVFVNLIFNALDAMPKGGDLSIVMRREGVFVIVEVADTGSGMSDEVQRRVFEPFFTTKGVKGTGLGLPVSYGIVSRHDGRIELDTELGRGTRFSIALPAISTRSVADEMARTVHAIGPPAHLADVVVVDDDASVAEMVAEALRDRGHAVRCATGGLAALEMLGVQPATVLVTDLSMPDMSGIDLALEARNRWPEIRTVLMTGADLSSLGDVPIEQIGDFTLSKPFEIDELVYLVESAAGLAVKK